MLRVFASDCHNLRRGKVKMRNRLTLIIFIIVLILAGCNKATTSEVEGDNENFNKEGFPIVNDPISLHFMVGKPPTTADDYNEVTIWKEYNKMTNIEIDWELVAKEGLAEKRNLTLVGDSDSLPDVFYSTSMPTEDLLKYGEMDMFVTLNDLIDEYMPNLTALFEEFPEIKRGLTFPDGNIYSLPTIYGPDFPSVLISSKLWIREDWLNDLNMEMPETLEQFHEYLTAVKETDLNGNGKHDEIPFGGTSDALNHFIQWISGAFGIQNRGTQQPYIDMDPEAEELRFFPTSDGYRDMIEYVHNLYTEELIQQNIFTVDSNQSYSMGSDGLYGSSLISSTETIYGAEEGSKFIGMPALKGPYEDYMFTKIRTPLVSMSGFVITNNNKHIPETLRWLDYFYSDEGAKLFFMGVEGTTYEEKDDGTVDYLDEIKNNPDGSTLEQQLAKHVTYLGGGYPGRLKQEYFNGAESTEAAIKAAEKVEPYLIDEVWPKFTFTSEESKRLSILKADIEKYVTEMRDKFITGDEPLSKWEHYVQEIERMGLEEYMEIQQKAYDRYLEAN